MKPEMINKIKNNEVAILNITDVFGSQKPSETDMNEFLAALKENQSITEISFQGAKFNYLKFVKVAESLKQRSAIKFSGISTLSEKNLINLKNVWLTSSSLKDANAEFKKNLETSIEVALKEQKTGLKSISAELIVPQQIEAQEVQVATLQAQEAKVMVLDSAVQKFAIEEAQAIVTEVQQGKIIQSTVKQKTASIFEDEDYGLQALFAEPEVLSTEPVIVAEKTNDNEAHIVEKALTVDSAVRKEAIKAQQAQTIVSTIKKAELVQRKADTIDAEKMPIVEEPEEANEVEAFEPFMGAVYTVQYMSIMVIEYEMYMLNMLIAEMMMQAYIEQLQQEDAIEEVVEEQNEKIVVLPVDGGYEFFSSDVLDTMMNMHSDKEIDAPFEIYADEIPSFVKQISQPEQPKVEAKKVGPQLAIKEMTDLIATLQNETKNLKESVFSFFFKLIGLVERKENKILELEKMVALAETRNTVGFGGKESLVVQQKSYASIGNYVEQRSSESMFKATMLMPFTFFAGASRTAVVVNNLRVAEAAIAQEIQAIKAIKA